MKTIQANFKLFQVDDDMYEIIKVLDRTTKKGGAIDHYLYIWFEGKLVSYTRWLLKAPDNMLVDHIDHNTLNNQRDNLRLATTQQNGANRRNTSNRDLPKGVTLENKLFRARIKVNGKMISVGSFLSAEEAKDAYIKAARKYFREFAYEG